MRMLAISSAYGGALAAMVADRVAEPVGRIDDEMGLAAALPGMVEGVLRHVDPPDAVAVVVGPGSFTGLRAGIAVASGIALALNIELIGVSVAEALSETLGGAGSLSGRQLWTAIIARRGRIFLDRGDSLLGFACDSLPRAVGRLAVAGNAAIEVAARLAAAGADVQLTTARRALPVDVVAVALRRMAGALAPLPALPLYVDEAEAKLPSGGLRAAPAQ